MDEVMLFDGMGEVVLNGQYMLPVYFDWLATFLFAFSGAVIAVEKGYDFVGVIVLAAVTSMGGSVIRDILLDAGIPAVLRDYHYLMFVLLGAFSGIFFYSLNNDKTMEFSLKMVDAISLGMYGVFGAQKAITFELSVFAAFSIGLINSIGGGILRNLLTRDAPWVLLPGHYYATAGIVSISMFLVLAGGFRLDAPVSAWVSISLCVIIRFLALYFGWKTKSINKQVQEFNKENK